MHKPTEHHSKPYTIQILYVALWCGYTVQIVLAHNATVDPLCMSFCVSTYFGFTLSAMVDHTHAHTHTCAYTHNVIRIAYFTVQFIK